MKVLPGAIWTENTRHLSVADTNKSSNMRYISLGKVVYDNSHPMADNWRRCIASHSSKVKSKMNRTHKRTQRSQLCNAG